MLRSWLRSRRWFVASGALILGVPLVGTIAAVTFLAAYVPYLGAWTAGGAALGPHPLAVLVVTIAGGRLVGAAGLIVAAPVTSAVVRISADLAKARGHPIEGADGPRVQAPDGVPA